MALKLTHDNADEPDNDRAKRARRERMLVIPHTDTNDDSTGLYTVHSESGSSYTVDVARESRCTCPDMEHNNPEGGCKHIRRVAIAIQENGLPAPGEDAGEYLDRLESTAAELEERVSVLEGFIAEIWARTGSE